MHGAIYCRKEIKFLLLTSISKTKQWQDGAVWQWRNVVLVCRYNSIDSDWLEARLISLSRWAVNRSSYLWQGHSLRVPLLMTSSFIHVMPFPPPSSCRPFSRVPEGRSWECRLGHMAQPQQLALHCWEMRFLVATLCTKLLALRSMYKVLSIFRHLISNYCILLSISATMSQIRTEGPAPDCEAGGLVVGPMTTHCMAYCSLLAV